MAGGKRTAARASARPPPAGTVNMLGIGPRQEDQVLNTYQLSSDII